MATFPSITPTYGVQKRSKPNTKTVKLGDGYEHRLLFGLNQNPKIFNLTFEVSETDADKLRRTRFSWWCKGKAGTINCSGI